jgi:hypothetical protein
MALGKSFPVYFGYRLYHSLNLYKSQHGNGERIRGCGIAGVPCLFFQQFRPNRGDEESVGI